MSRRGFLSLWLLLSLSAVLAASGAFLYAASHTVRAESAALQGLRAQYAAESGAAWALEKIRREGMQTRSASFDLDENAKCKVKIDGSTSKILARGEDVSSGAFRYVQLTVYAEKKEDSYAVTVQMVGNQKW